jgi:hypothetical protein
MDSSYTRTGLSVLSSDGSDAVSAYRTSIRNLAAWAEANAPCAGKGLSARPAAGKAGTFYKATDAATGILYYDNGTTWETIGAAPPTDGSAATPSLRTLGSGSTQAAAGNHTHGASMTATVRGEAVRRPPDRLHHDGRRPAPDADPGRQRHLPDHSARPLCSGRQLARSR